MTTLSHPRRLAGAALIALAFVGQLGAPAKADGEAKILAPSGSLRVGVYPGSPTSMVTDASGKPHGLSYDLGGELAKRLGVAVDYVRFQRVADIVSAIHDGQVDFTVTNATPARANDVSFSQPVLTIELGYLVPANSVINAVSDIDRPGVKIGVTKGSTSERTLPAKFKNATIVPAESVKVAIAMFGRGEIDLYATNKPTLFEMSDQMPGARILEGNWGLEHMAIAIPKGREEALPLLNRFVTEEQSSGALDAIQQQAGLRGASKATRE
ncbi:MULTISPECIES: ABC transporter substrate-binding protein [unclassified Bradyrhizobium]|uniref:ABC transporter substrate-binding protein n=1 Tax=unclassified Bradyrhizobium TaxID=2631580 RepID=UPI00247AB8FF|nr:MULTISPECIES: ABC transporter substrate-binding protein [unclassified Bradyrhizobium]WGR68521.1 ABC transporter substrate-binding protein [Bradyrhizobium sp. ISRA426]WGR80576.1 ABC transporter substrate-binding protein [Bradyrhizobium sp. ISRA430]WGR83761.1 ABC transporter substrate-binding protein [Bradyrhizobium sp. ISRA432]